MYKIIVANYRDDSSGPMQVVSGPLGKETVHFEAPSATLLKSEMNHFLEWLNTPDRQDPILKAGIAHFWFISLHPFEDGNGRIARAITDMILCRSEKKARRFYSLSSQIEKERKAYYKILESSQKSTLDITDWLFWFLNCLKNSIDEATSIVEKIMAKHKFWNTHKTAIFNERQIKVLELLLSDFFGKLNTSKWAEINRCSQDTA